MAQYPGIRDYIERLKGRLAELRPLPQEDRGPAPGGPAAAAVFLCDLVGEFEELRNALEELQVADEELREQHEHLLQLRERLEAERLRYQDLFNGAPDAYLVTDPGGNILEANRAAATLLRVPQHHLCTKPLVLYIAGRDRAQFWVELNAASQSAELREFELLVQPRNNEAIDASVRVAPILSRAQHPVGLRWLIRNINRRKQAERMLQASLAQLRQSQRLASIGTWASGIAYELGNPLNAILMAVECATQTASDCRRDGILRIVRDEAQRMSQIVKGLLQFAKAEETPKEPADLNDVVRRTADLVRALLPHDSLQLELRLTEHLPPVLLNSTAMEQALINLIRNSVEAKGDSTRVSICTISDSHGISVEVVDNGPGVSNEHLQRIFDPFFTTHQNEGRIGLGLSIVHSIVADHGGSVTARSRLGQGSTFTIRLPLPGRG